MLESGSVRILFLLILEFRWRSQGNLTQKPKPTCLCLSNVPRKDYQKKTPTAVGERVKLCCLQQKLLHSVRCNSSLHSEQRTHLCATTNPSTTTSVLWKIINGNHNLNTNVRKCKGGGTLHISVTFKPPESVFARNFPPCYVAPQPRRHERNIEE